MRGKKKEIESLAARSRSSLCSWQVMVNFCFISLFFDVDANHFKLKL